MIARCKGFTLIELSIVLVIIGLIVGGVLVGRDLILAAQLRKTVSTIESFTTAKNTFRLKYNQTPGDMNSSGAAMFGMTTRSGAEGHGDGNGLIDGCSANTTVFGCENALFWSDLSSAQLIAGNYASATDALTSISASSVRSYLPDVSVPSTAHVIVHNGSYGTSASPVLAGNYFSIVQVLSSDAAGVYDLETALSPLNAKQIDLKLDDGRPTRGRVVGSQRSFVSSSQGFIMTDDCHGPVAFPDPLDYAVTVDSPLCIVAIAIR